MIDEVYSPTLQSFRTLRFHDGLNILLADKGPEASARDTRNRSGKTSFVELIHFLLGERATTSSLFRQSALREHTFGVVLDLGGEKKRIERTGKAAGDVRVSTVRGSTAAAAFIDARHATRTLSNPEWCTLLGESMFQLTRQGQDSPLRKEKEPSFRMLFPYFARRENEGGFQHPTATMKKQNEGDRQVALTYLFGLEWRIAREWQDVRDRESGLKALNKLTQSGTDTPFTKKPEEIQPKLRTLETRVENLRRSLADFRIHPEYDRLKNEANDLTQRISVLSAIDTADGELLRDLESSLQSEVPPGRREVSRLYTELGILFPPQVMRRFEEVEAFHAAVIENRRGYLRDEMQALQRRTAERAVQLKQLDESRASVMQTLKSHGALEQFGRLQGDLNKQEAQVEGLRRELDLARQVASQGVLIGEEKRALKDRLERAHGDRATTIQKATSTFAEISRSLYREKPGSLDIRASQRGPEFKLPIHGGRSKGIRNMQTFAFDVTLMSLWTERRAGPGFLIHDSHIFDGVDPDQIALALQIGENRSKAEGWQYIVTMNTDTLPAAYREPKKLREVEVPVRIGDTDTAGLFGFRFDPDKD